MNIHRKLCLTFAMGATMALAIPAAAQQQQQQQQQAPDRPAANQREQDEQRPSAQQDEANRADSQRRTQNQQQEDRNAQKSERGASEQQGQVMLGIGFRQDAAQDQGLEIGGVMPGSAAANANLNRGDVIVSVDGQQVRSAQELDRIIQQRSIGDTTDLVILRNGQRQEVQVTLTEVPADFDPRYESRRPEFDDTRRRGSHGWLGITLETTSARGEPGVGINSTYPAGPAARAGLQPGDRILEVSGRQVSHYQQVLDIVRQTQPGDSIDLVVASNGQQESLSVRLDDAGVFSANREDEFSSSFMWRDPSGHSAEIPEHDMMLEQHRRFAEQHYRIEELLREVKQDLDLIKQQMQIESPEGQPSPRRNQSQPHANPPQAPSSR